MKISSLKNTAKNNPTQIHFNRWTRKNYAVYNSLGKQVKIGVLAFCCSILMLNSSAFASVSSVQKILIDDDSGTDILPDTITLETAIIQAQPKTMVSSLSRVVVSFDRQDIQKLPVQNIQQLLYYVGAVDLRERGGQGVQADIGIRGGSFDQVMIMLNGVNFTDPQTGHHNLNLPIDLGSIERIEILQGPGSRVLGANAAAGAINIVTMTSDTNLIGAKIAVGEHHFSDVNAFTNLIRKKIKIHASVGKTASTGYTTNTDFDINNAFLQMQIGNLQHGKLNVQSGYQLKKFGANAFYSFKYPTQYEQLRTFLNALSYEQKIAKTMLNANIYHRRSYDRFELFRYETPDWYGSHNYHQSDVLGANLRSELSYHRWKTLIGAEFRSEHIFSNVLGEKMETLRNVPFEADSIVFTHTKQRSIANWFVEQSFFASRYSFSIGAMGSFSNDFGHHTCFGADFSYQLLHDLSLFATLNQSLRLPTFTDLYYSSATILGNPNLKPERSNTIEIGSKFNRFGLLSNVSVFYREGKNTIDWVKPFDEELSQSRNHTQINTFGVEADALYHFQHAHFQSFRATYAYLNMSKDNLGMQESGRKLDYLRHKLAFNLNLKFTANFFASLGWTYRDRVGQYLDLQGNTMTLTDVNLIDLKLEWRTSTYQIFVEATNLFNEKYFDYTNLIQAGRWIKAGVTLQIRN